LRNQWGELSELEKKGKYFYEIFEIFTLVFPEDGEKGSL